MQPLSQGRMARARYAREGKGGRSRFATIQWRGADKAGTPLVKTSLRTQGTLARTMISGKSKVGRFSPPRPRRLPLRPGPSETAAPGAGFYSERAQTKNPPFSPPISRERPAISRAVRRTPPISAAVGCCALRAVWHTAVLRGAGGRSRTGAPSPGEAARAAGASPSTSRRVLPDGRQDAGGA